MKSRLKTDITLQLKKSQHHFSYSFNKIKNYDLTSGLDRFNEIELEALESFAARFARTSDLVIQKYLRLLAFEQDPAYQGSVVDLLNLSEKRGWITSSKDWLKIRELRNLIAHEYSIDNFADLYRELIKLSSFLLSINISDES